MSPNGRYVIQIDHVMIEREEERNITNIRSYRGPDMDSDQFYVGIKLKIKIPVNKNRKKEAKENLPRLKEEKNKLKYKDKLKIELENCNENLNINEKWEALKQIMKESVKGCNDRKEGAKRWFDDSCREKIEKRNKVRQESLKKGTEEAMKKYSEQRKECKKFIREKKRRYNEERILEIEEQYRNNEIRSMYRGIRKEKEGYKNRMTFCKGKNGELLTDENEILERWKGYFEELLNGEMLEDEGISEEEEVTEEEVEGPPDINEIEEIIRGLKTNKSPGYDEITVEMIKYGGTLLIKKIQQLIEIIWNQEQMPREWSEAILCPIYKKGDKENCENYRGIALLNVVYKILATSIKNKLCKGLDYVVSEYQCGFRKGRGVMDQIFTLREIQAESYEYQKPTYVIFIDFKQAYDRIQRKELFKGLQELGVNHKIISMIKMTLRSTQNRIRIRQGISERFEVKVGLRQGDPLSSILFTLALEIVLRKAFINREGLVYHKKHQCLAFADDIAIVARSKQEIQQVIRRLESAAKEMGLEINEKKTKYMTWV